MRCLRIPALGFCLQLALLASSAQQPPQSLPTPQQKQSAISTAAPLPPAKEQIRRTVGFLEVAYRNGLSRGSAIGTCFFVAVPDPRIGPRGFVYLVTNRHVAQPGVDLGPPYEVQDTYLRMNLSIPEHGIQAVTEKIPLGGGMHWFFPTDDAVDLAILRIAPDEKRYAYMTVPLNMVAGPELLKSDHVEVGNSVIFAGFFRSFFGQTRMEPIVRQGVIAMLPEEKLDTTLHKKGQLVLADLHAFHGNSGSPVFANVGGIRGNIVTVENYILLGIISGYFPESAGYSVPAATVLTGEVRDDSGIATIVPGEELVKLLNSQDVRADRDEQIAKLPNKP